MKYLIGAAIILFLLFLVFGVGFITGVAATIYKYLEEKEETSHER